MTDNTPQLKKDLLDELPEAMLEEAAIWQARLRDANPGTTEEGRRRAEFSEWLLADTRHRQAFAEMEALWGVLEVPVEQWGGEKAGKGVHNSVKDFPLRGNDIGWWLTRRFVTAACLVLAICVTVGWHQDWITQWQSDYVTAVGEEVPIQTDDGSRITLNTDSALAMDYNAGERRVKLLKGEAWFNVAPTDKRPFIVDTGAGAVRVTGTRFNVRLVNDTAVVSLDEGRVELRPSGTANVSPVVLTPGQQAVLAGKDISAPIPFDHTQVTAWLRGQFVFYNTPLAEVVDTLNRYRHGRIVVASHELNHLKVSGIFSTEDPDAALDVIASTLPIQQTRLTDYLVLIR